MLKHYSYCKCAILNFIMIFKSLMKSIVSPEKLATFVYLLALMKLCSALPRDYKAVSVPHELVAEDNPSDRFPSNWLKRPSSSAKILTQIVLSGDLGAPDLIINIEYTHEQIMTVNTMIVDDNMDRANNNNKPVNVNPLIFYNDKKIRILNAPSSHEPETNRVPTTSFFVSESTVERSSHRDFESTTPMITSLSNEIEGPSLRPEILVTRSTKVNGITQQSSANIKQATKQGISKTTTTSMTMARSNLKTTEKDSKNENISKFTSNTRKTTQQIPKTTLRLTTPRTTIEVNTRDSKGKGFDDKTVENNTEVTSLKNIDITTEKSTSEVNCKVPSISDIDIWKIAEAIKILYGGTTLNNVTSEKLEQIPTTTEQITLNPMTSAWYKLVSKSAPTQSKRKKFGLAKISYR